MKNKAAEGQISVRKSISGKKRETSGKIYFENSDAFEFSDKPTDLLTTSFENEKEICVKNASVNIKTVIDSYIKCIGMRQYYLGSANRPDSNDSLF